jgi:hypothetical protein
MGKSYAEKYGSRRYFGYAVAPLSEAVPEATKKSRRLLNISGQTE